MGRHLYVRKWWRNEFVFALKNDINEASFLISSSFSVSLFFGRKEEKTFIKKIVVGRKEKWSRKESRGNCNFKFIWQINFMASCIAVDPVRAGKTFSFSLKNFPPSLEKGKAIFKILFILKCASNIAHFSHFDFYRYARCFSFDFLFLFSVLVAFVYGKLFEFPREKSFQPGI